MPKPTELVKQARQSIASKRYPHAAQLLNQALKPRGLSEAYYLLAKLYLNGHLTSDDPITQALDYFKEIVNGRANGKKHHDLVKKQCLALLKDEKYQSQPLQARIYNLIAHCEEPHTGETILNHIHAAAHNLSSSFESLYKTLNHVQSNKYRNWRLCEQIVQGKHKSSNHLPQSPQLILLLNIFLSRNSIQRERLSPGLSSEVPIKPIESEIITTQFSELPEQAPLHTSLLRAMKIWLSEDNERLTAIDGHLFKLLSVSHNQQAEQLELMIQHLSSTQQFHAAIKYASLRCDLAEREDINLRLHQETLLRFYEQLNDDENIKKYQVILGITGTKKKLTEQAQNALRQWGETKDFRELEKAIEYLYLAAQQKDSRALSQLKNMSEHHSNASVVVVKIYESHGRKVAEKTKQLDEFDYKPSELKKYTARARTQLQDAYANRKPGSSGNLGIQYLCDGLLIADLARARTLLAESMTTDDTRFAVDFAKLCFEGLGGPQDLSAAKQAVKLLAVTNPKACEMLIEICWQEYFVTKVEDDLNHAIEIGIKHDLPQASLDKQRLQTVHSSDHNGERRNPPMTSYEEAVRVLNEKQDSRKLLLLCQQENHPQKAQAKKVLLNHYQTPNGTLHLISTLLYEARRHAWTSNICSLLRELIETLDSNMKDKTETEYSDYLTDQEQKERNYFDEYPTDDSDEDEEKHHIKTRRVNRRRGAFTQAIISQIEKQAKTKLSEIQKKKDDKLIAKAYSDFQASIQNLYATKFEEGNRPTTLGSKEDIKRDLRRLNDANARGELESALRIIKIPYVIAQYRGIHFNTASWNKPMRAEYHQQFKSTDEPLLNKPLYSSAVFKHADTSSFLHDDIMLERSARHLLKQLNQLVGMPPHDSSELPEKIRNALENYYFKDRNTQIQHLYTNHYDLFHDYIAWEKDQPNSIFVNEKNHFVSTSDLPLHGLKYAYGIKPYKADRHERLRPCWDKNNRAHHPHSGAVYLTLHPLDDFILPGHNHIASMNMHGNIEIRIEILHEREVSFFSYIPSERVKYIHDAKYPSFDSEYRAVNKHQYGLNENLYKSFKRLFNETAPHTPKRRLVKLLLGEYLCAYHNLRLQKVAFDVAFAQKRILIFRDEFGNFSLKPPQNINPSPKGDDMRSRSMRDHADKQRAALRTAPSIPLKRPLEEAEQEELTQRPTKEAKGINDVNNNNSQIENATSDSAVLSARLG